MCGAPVVLLRDLMIQTFPTLRRTGSRVPLALYDPVDGSVRSKSDGVSTTVWSAYFLQPIAASPVHDVSSSWTSRSKGSGSSDYNFAPQAGIVAEK